ncbi:MAG: DUF6516 family protein [Bacteriovorax sp.]|nr:DUF6516 family protein [Bacteriovorax sp.]
MLAKKELLHKSKLILNSGLVREIVIWRVPQNKNYPEGIKYRMLLVDPHWKKVLVLLDNDAPKGHHRHDSIGGEFPYRFISVKLLVEDFLRLELIQEKQYENNEN